MTVDALFAPTSAELSFFVPGKPQTAGSKVAVPITDGAGEVKGRRIVESGDRQKKHSWRDDLRQAAAHALRDACYHARPTWPDAALEVRLTFVRQRPSSMLRTGRHAGQLHPWALDRRPTTRPDALKLARAAEDALTGTLWADDSQIVDEHLHKAYGDQVGMDPRAEGLLVVVRVAQSYPGPPIVAVDSADSVGVV